MTNCEMCGAEERTYPTLIEGVELRVCKRCSSFGKAVKRPARARIRKMYNLGIMAGPAS